MKKDEIIVLLKEQLQQANATVSSLTTQVNELIDRIKSLEEQMCIRDRRDPSSYTKTTSHSLGALTAQK